MKQSILVAGATGNLGGRIVNALLDRGAEVRALVRSSSDATKIKNLEKLGVEVFKVNTFDVKEASAACTGASCVVSALSGLREVIVDVQKVYLGAAVAAGVPRFIPSDYSTDFTRLPVGENRNFDLRKEFQAYLDKSPVAATSIFNGAFADILTYNTPTLDLKKKTVGYLGENADWHLDFTTMDDTAAYTAEAALDASTPRILRIASFQISPNELVALAREATKSAFILIPMGTLDRFAAFIERERAGDPAGENELNPRWQSGQYMHGMFSVHHESLDNNRYPHLQWTSAAEFISSIV